MSMEVAPAQFFSLLADELRWQIVSALAGSDYRVQELVNLVHRPVNLVSYHLARLRGMKLVTERRSDADSRDVYYSLNLDRLRTLYREAGDSLHPAIVSEEDSLSDPLLSSRQPRIRVLFLCTENSARSQMAEGLLRHLSHGQIEVVSAGSSPTEVHPLAILAMSQLGIDIAHHRSKSLEEYRDEHFDFVITVCDRVREICPAFPGDPERIHWSFADPATVEGPLETRREAFRRTANELRTMIGYLLIVIERGKTWTEPRGDAA